MNSAKDSCAKLVSRRLLSLGRKRSRSPLVQGVGSQTFHVEGVIDIRMLGVQFDKALRRLDGRFVLVVVVVGVDQFQLGLLGVSAEGKPGFQQLQALHRHFIAAVAQVALGGVVQLRFGGSALRQFQFIIV